jgi:hypothetical protein
MTAAEIVAEALARGFWVELNPARDGLIIWPDDPPPDLVNLLKRAKPQIVEALRRERARINHWIANQIINGPRWIAVASGEASAHFHEPCHAEWLAKQETAARKAMGLAAINQENA